MWDPNKNYIPVGYPFIAYPKKAAKGQFNADVAGTWEMTPSKLVPVLNSKESCKVLAIHKEDTVDVELYQFYSNVSGKELRKHFKKTRSILRFSSAN